MLEAAGLEPEVERSSRTSPLGDSDAAALLESVERVIVCRGRKAVVKSAAEAEPEDLAGPTGNIRAPLLQVDDTLLVGFNRDALNEALGL